jgi:acyl-CoA thioester hydrolase
MSTASTAPFAAHAEPIRPEWIDYNGHMNLAYYVLVFDHGTDAVMAHLGLGFDYVQATNCSMFVAETHVTYEREVRQGDLVRVSSRFLGADRKRLHLFHEMHHQGEGYLAATNELMILHVDLGTRRTRPFEAEQSARIGAMVTAHSDYPLPSQIGRSIALERVRAASG